MARRATRRIRSSVLITEAAHDGLDHHVEAVGVDLARQPVDVEKVKAKCG
jgi:hypothetical protein